jgi:hypothetical protein
LAKELGHSRIQPPDSKFGRIHPIIFFVFFRKIDWQVCIGGGILVLLEIEKEGLPSFEEKTY